MKSLITGINGFAGSYLAELLLSKKDKVFGFFQPGTSLDNISEIKDKVVLRSVDILDNESINYYVSSIKPDRIFHLAGLSSVKQSILNPYLTYKVNINGTLNLLEAIRSNSLRTKFLFVSSSEVYGKNAVGKVVTENTVPLPQSHYAVSKLCAENIVLSYSKFEKIEIFIARPSNHIGPKQSEDFFIPTLAKQLALIKTGKMQPIIKLGNINIKRDFTDVRDVVNAYVLITEKAKSGDVYNICSGKSIFLKEAVYKMFEIAKVKAEITTDSSKIRKTEVEEIRVSNSKIRAILKWKTNYSLVDSLTDIYTYWLRKIQDDKELLFVPF